MLFLARLLLVPGVVVLPACSEYDIQKFESVDVFYQDASKAVDILMIVDDSCSMEPFQQKLGESFEAFMTYFIDTNVDYQIAVTTTDVTSWRAGQIRGEVIGPATESAASRFSEAVNVGTLGSGFEMGLEAAAMALSEPLVSTDNFGFLREDATLSLIFVSDEEDGSPNPVNDYINGFYELKGHRNREVLNASALTVTDLSECPPSDYSSTAGDRYVDVAQQTGGIVGNLCAADFENIVVDLSLNTSRLRDTFFLSDKPDLSTIQVALEDVEIPCDAGQWSYQLVDKEGEPAPAIVFERDFMPGASQRIAVRYDPGGGDPVDFCSEEEVTP